MTLDLVSLLQLYLTSSDSIITRYYSLARKILYLQEEAAMVTPHVCTREAYCLLPAKSPEFSQVPYMQNEHTHYLRI